MCQSLTSEQLDHFGTAFKAARVFAGLANLCVGAGTLVLLVSTCAYFEVALLKICGAVFFVGCLFQALMFLAFSSMLTKEPYDGSFYWGSIVNMVGCFLTFCAGVQTLYLPPSEHDESNNGTDRHKIKPPTLEQPRA